MLDENLPTFYLSPNPDGIKHHKSLFLSQYGSDAEPAYSLHYLDPSSPTATNRYALALLDAHNSDIVYGEVLVHPRWTNPSLSVDEIHRNGGVPPPPQPQLPGEITIQLYNPDQSITISQKPGSWGASPSYEFSMPSVTFRTPSASMLDRSQNDPSADISTPRLHFSWKKEGKLSKDFLCAMVGKSTDVLVKKKNKDPDIAVALFRSAKEVTMYESNMSRVDIEDTKGLELVLLLGAIAIRDVYLGSIKEVFHIGSTSRRDSKARKTPPLSNNGLPHQRQHTQTPTAAVVAAPAALGQPHAPPQQKLPLRTTNSSSSKPPSNPQGTHTNTHPSSTDPRTQWAVDAEAARQRAQAEQQRKERAKTEEADRRRAQKVAEQEAKEQRRRQAEVDRETERLRKKYGVQQQQQQQQQGQAARPTPAQSGRKTAGVLPQHGQFLHPNHNHNHNYNQHHHPPPPQNKHNFLQHQQQRRHSSTPVNPSQRPYIQHTPAQSALQFHGPSRPSHNNNTNSNNNHHHHSSPHKSHHHQHHHKQQHRHSHSSGNNNHHRQHHHSKPSGNSPYLQVPGGGGGGGGSGLVNASLSTFFNKLSEAANNSSAAQPGHHNLGAPRKSLFGLRSRSDEHATAGMLGKKRSSIF